MNYHIDIQNVSNKRLPLTHSALHNLAALALRDQKKQAELTIRLVRAEEMTALNNQYRQKNKVTNVLAFPSSLPECIELETPFLGDIVICPEVLRTESKHLHKVLKAHWALIVIHGVLHLLGYDHINTADADKMQTIEIGLLAELGFESPYDTEDNTFE
ncbi:MAG: rRNA maturation RNase YbeY [Legionella sp.]|nr:rRNA maturation RNase YbeY [Legionella sp.]